MCKPVKSKSLYKEFAVAGTCEFILTGPSWYNSTQLDSIGRVGSNRKLWYRPTCYDPIRRYTRVNWRLFCNRTTNKYTLNLQLDECLVPAIHHGVSCLCSIYKTVWWQCECDALLRRQALYRLGSECATSGLDSLRLGRLPGNYLAGICDYPCYDHRSISGAVAQSRCVCHIWATWYPYSFVFFIANNVRIAY